MNHNAVSSGDSTTLLVITGWKYDDVSSQTGRAQVRGQGEGGSRGTITHTNCGRESDLKHFFETK